MFYMIQCLQVLVSVVNTYKKLSLDFFKLNKGLKYIGYAYFLI